MMSSDDIRAEWEKAYVVGRRRQSRALFLWGLLFGFVSGFVAAAFVVPSASLQIYYLLTESIKV